MHILIVSHNYPHKLDLNYGFFCKTQAEALAAAGIKVGVVGALPISLKLFYRKRTFIFGSRAFKLEGVNTHLFFFPSIPKLQKIRYWVLKRIGVMLLNDYIRMHGKPDVVHLQVYHAAEVAIYAKMKFGIPIVWTEHFQDIDNNLASEYQWGLINKLAPLCDARIAVSKNLKRNLEEKFNMSFIYVPNMYDSDLFKLAFSEKKSPTFTFIHISSLNSNKNQSRLLKAFHLAFQQIDDVRLVIVGDGEDFELIKELIVRLGLVEKVEMRGALAKELVYLEIKKSHVIVSSSDYETFGVGIIEAMACGLPAVSTRSGGPESIIDEHIPNGMLTERTIESLAEGLIAIHSQYYKYDPKRISDYVISHFSRKEVARSLIGVYSQCTLDRK